MNGGSSKAAASAAAAGQAGVDPVKERVFSLIRKASQEGITDGRRRLWIDFTPHIVVEEKEGGYVMRLWRECVVVKITLDREFNVTGFDVEGPCR